MENHIFWLVWLVITVVTMIIFMNFIIAEIGASYAKVKGKIDTFREKRKANLIAEAQYMLPDFMMTPDRFPKYYIKRIIVD